MEKLSTKVVYNFGSLLGTKNLTRKHLQIILDYILNAIIWGFKVVVFN